jgi:hypothetical protein
MIPKEWELFGNKTSQTVHLLKGVQFQPINVCIWGIFYSLVVTWISDNAKVSFVWGRCKALGTCFGITVALGSTIINLKVVIQMAEKRSYFYQK